MRNEQPEGSMTDRDYLVVWLALECIGIEGQRLVLIDGNTCDDIEEVLEATFADGSTALYEGGGHPTGIETRRERTYYFAGPARCPHPDVVFLGDTSETLDTFAVLVDGQIASRAWSVRRTNTSAEIAVETVEMHRRKGYGSQVVSAWVSFQLQQGKHAIYSHRIGNLESQALAEKTGARQFVDVVSYY